jgi:hypothetical protein
MQKWDSSLGVKLQRIRLQLNNLYVPNFAELQSPTIDKPLVDTIIALSPCHYDIGVQHTSRAVDFHSNRTCRRCHNIFHSTYRLRMNWRPRRSTLLAVEDSEPIE